MKILSDVIVTINLLQSLQTNMSNFKHKKKKKTKKQKQKQNKTKQKLSQNLFKICIFDN